jgi:arylsulfatase A-like enzyme
VILLAHLASPVHAEKPNFVIIFTDDQGYGDLGCFGATHVHTPNIDKMAAEGARLTSFYVAAAVCTPSRAGLMTGCYPKRIGMATGSDFGVLLAGDHKVLYYYNGTNLQAVREGQWKLHLPRTAQDQPFWCKKPIGGRVFVTLDQPALFNLKDDLAEKRNVAEQHPEVVARLQKRANAIRAELGDVRVNGADQRVIRLQDPQER